MNINGKAVLVTGGASGLGLATVRRLHAEGAYAVVVDLSASDGKAVVEDLGERASFVAADVTDESEVQAAVKVALEHRPLAAVVNCAGIGTALRLIGKDGTPFPLADFRRTIDVNLVGTFNVTRLAAAAMIASTPLEGEERGVIIHTASVAAFEGQIGQAAYSASKGGVVGMTLPIARELAQHRIRVNAIAPGLFWTPMFQSLPEAAISSLAAQVPHPSRLGQPAEYANLVSHIVDNAMLNGETIRLDGAIRMGPR